MTKTSAIRTTALPFGETVPVLGQGTWKMGEDSSKRAAEVAALQLGLDLGMTLIDTAEMYADGGAEKVVGEAMLGRRDDVFLVSKFYPHHAQQAQMVKACEQSLKRLKTEYLDLYLLHWRGTVPLEETMAGFETLISNGKIRHWGISNFDCDGLSELTSLSGGAGLATNQVLYNLKRRGIEWQVLPWCRQHNVPVMAYSPVEQGDLLNHSALKAVAERHQVNTAQIALAWLLRQDGIIAIPKAVQVQHLHENVKALTIQLEPDDITELDRAFPKPKASQPLEMI